VVRYSEGPLFRGSAIPRVCCCKDLNCKLNDTDHNPTNLRPTNPILKPNPTNPNPNLWNSGPVPKDLLLVNLNK